MDFSRKSNENEFSRKSNGVWIFLGIKWGFCKEKKQGAKEKKSNFFGFPWGFCMDFLRNQTRMNFPGNRMGYGFSWGFCKEKTQGAKKKSNFFGFLWGFCMDFLENQTRMNFPENRMGDGFSWESNRGFSKRKHRKKKKHFIWFSLGVLHGFSRKSNENEFSWKSNGGWIFLGIKRGFCKEKTQEAKKKQFFWFPQGFCMDFLINQTRMNFLENRMGDGFSWESNEDCKKKKKKQ